jgi:putative exosortase-associated protein (TIGR04073 family)
MNSLRHLSLAAAVAAGLVFSPVESRADGMLDKLGRGMANLMFGIVDIPATLCEETRNEGPAIGLTAGLFKAFGHFFAREFVGAYEVVTFPVACPDNFKPYMTPEFPWDRFNSAKEDYSVSPPPVVPPPKSPAK